MKTLWIFSLLLAPAYAQPIADPFTTGITLMSLVGCPIFVTSVAIGSPAQRAGIVAGDRLSAVDHNLVVTSTQAARLLRVTNPSKVTLTLLRDDKEFEVTLERERSSTIVERTGQKVVSGVIVPLNTLQAEVDRMLAFDGQRYVARIFPSHYPKSSALYYAGFEVFVLRDPNEVAVGGIEKGPASMAGVHWGDVIVSVNGQLVSEKNASQLEEIFLATKPGSMRLVVDRLGSQRTFDFTLESAGEIARQNGKRLVASYPVPSWADQQTLKCLPKN